MRKSGRRGFRPLIGAATYALVLAVAVTLNFALPRLAPGDPLDYIVGPELGSMAPEDQARLRVELGLDGSLIQQYGRYLGDLARGDLGVSLRYARPVSTILRERIPWSVLLVAPAFVIGFLLSVMLGLAAARRRGRWPDVGLLTGTQVLDAMPVFWLAMILLIVFSVHLGWFPSFGAVPLTHPGSTGALVLAMGHRLVLPTVAMVLGSLGHTFLLTRGSLLTTLGEDYVAMAEAKGLSPRRVTYRHALRNALLPLYTHLALSLGGIFSGAVLVETVFGYPGIGRMLFEAVASRDYPLLQGGFLLTIATVVLANFFADVTYPLLDPRVRRASDVVN
ncbi:MAG: ABC transporter permease [Gemmatimonadota bacterium]